MVFDWFYTYCNCKTAPTSTSVPAVSGKYRMTLPKSKAKTGVYNTYLYANNATWYAAMASPTTIPWVAFGY